LEDHKLPNPTLVPNAPPLVKGYTFESMTPGLTFQTFARTIREADYTMFVQLAGFVEPIFLDDRCPTDSFYEGRLVPGQMTYTVGEGLVQQTNFMHGTGLALLHVELDAIAPVYVGDTLDVIVEVTDSRPTSQTGRGVVTSQQTVRNQRREAVLSYAAVRLIRSADATQS
jgi:acyl dehydratase